MNRPVVAVLVLVLLAAAGGAVYYLKFAKERPLVAPLELPAQPLPEPEEVPRIIHPVPDDPTAPMPAQTATAEEAPVVPQPESQPEPAKPLPALDESDPAILDSVTGVFDRSTLETLFNLDGIIRRLVVTIDNLPRQKLPMRHVINRATGGRFMALGEDDNRVLDPANFSRYTPFVRVVEALDTDQMVGLYVRHYPLFQQAYEELGYPSAYFNDRLVEVIDELLATPEVSGPIRLLQPRVFYTFADADLEALSAGQKVLIRVGPVNAARLKAKLRELRRVLATGAS